MTKFIEVNIVEGTSKFFAYKECLLNVDIIESIVPEDSRAGSTIFTKEATTMTDSHFLHVKESYDEIKAMLMGDGK